MQQAVQAVDFTSFVFSSNDDIKTTSLLIAEKFSKSHAHVLRDIEKIMAQVSDIFNKTNFGLIEVDVKVGFGTRKDKGYELTKDGFIMVVMSYTGAKAFAIKEAYINAFNLMHAKLFPKSSTLRESFTCPFANQQQSAPVALSPEFVTPAQAKMVEHIVADIQQYVHFEKSASWNVYASIRELYKVESFAKLPAKHFDAVIHSLNEKLELAKKHHYLLCKADQVFIKNVLKKSSLQLNAPLQYGLLA